MSKIHLTGASSEDFDDYYRIRCEPSDIYWMGHTSAPDYQMIRSVFHERLGSNALSVAGDKVIYMARNEKEETVGFTMLSLTEFGIEIGISLLQRYHGQGFGTQMVEEVLSIAKSLNKPIFACIRDDNYASQRIFIKNGFQRSDHFELREYPKVGTIPFRKYIYTE